MVASLMYFLFIRKMSLTESFPYAHWWVDLLLANRSSVIEITTLCIGNKIPAHHHMHCYPCIVGGYCYSNVVCIGARGDYD